eukprot:6179311-Pleurochrysis_carterae.AAC.2
MDKQNRKDKIGGGREISRGNRESKPGNMHTGGPHGRAKTQIDNILVPIELIHTFKEAHVATGVREKDHRMVMASLGWGVKCGKEEKRPTRRYTDKFEEEHWHKYDRISTERIQEIREKMGNKRPSDKLRILQTELTRMAAEVVGEKGEEETPGLQMEQTPISRKKIHGGQGKHRRVLEKEGDMAGLHSE